MGCFGGMMCMVVSFLYEGSWRGCWALLRVITWNRGFDIFVDGWSDLIKTLFNVKASRAWEEDGTWMWF